MHSIYTPYLYKELPLEGNLRELNKKKTVVCILCAGYLLEVVTCTYNYLKFFFFNCSLICFFTFKQFSRHSPTPFIIDMSLLTISVVSIREGRAVESNPLSHSCFSPQTTIETCTVSVHMCQCLQHDKVKTPFLTQSSIHSSIFYHFQLYKYRHGHVN